MRKNVRGGYAWVTLLAWAFAPGCQGGSAQSANDAPKDLNLPGVDTHDLTPRENHEFARYVTELASPCPAVAIPLAQCILEKRPCARCTSAASAVATAVREGMAREQVEGLYAARFDPSGARTVPIGNSPTRGPEQAAVTIVEFADFECPYCQRVAPALDAACEKHKSKVRFVFKFMPLAMHPHSELAAGAAVAAEMQGKFWEMHDLLFANGSRLEPSDLEEYARAIGLDLDRFRQDVASPVVKERIAADRKLADDLGVRATPTIFINGRNYDLQANLDDWIDGEIAAGASP